MTQKIPIAARCLLSGLAVAFRVIRVERGIVVPVLLLTAGLLAANKEPAFSSPEQTQATPSQKASALRIIPASEWKGGVEVGGECGAATGEYSYWVYATATRCGVPREQADRLVSVRQPIPGMAPLSARAELPEGRYAVWVYGWGQPGHPWVILCGKDCVTGELLPTPSWVLIGWVELRDNQGLLFRTYRQPDGHRLDVQQVVLSSNEIRPDWVP